MKSKDIVPSRWSKCFDFTGSMHNITGREGREKVYLIVCVHVPVCARSCTERFFVGRHASESCSFAVGGTAAAGRQVAACCTALTTHTTPSAALLCAPACLDELLPRPSD